MKRKTAFFILLICMAIYVLPSYSDGSIDYSTLTDEALAQIIRDARIEMSKRNLRNNDDYLVALDSQGIQLVYLGTYGFLSPYQKKAVYLDYTVINSNDFAISFTLENTMLNGWSSIPFTGFTQVEPSSRMRNSVGFYLENAMITELSELEDLQFTLNCRRTDTGEIVDRAKVTIIFDQMSVKK